MAAGLWVVNVVEGVQRHARVGREDLVDEHVDEVGDGVDAAQPVVDGSEGGGVGLGGAGVGRRARARRQHALRLEAAQDVEQLAGGAGGHVGGVEGARGDVHEDAPLKRRDAQVHVRRVHRPARVALRAARLVAHNLRRARGAGGAQYSQ